MAGVHNQNHNADRDNIMIYEFMNVCETNRLMVGAHRCICLEKMKKLPATVKMGMNLRQDERKIAFC